MSSKPLFNAPKLYSVVGAGYSYLKVPCQN